jgi:flagellar motor component MotA
MKALQPLIQGSLVTQVNEGPKKIAEVFLGRGSQHDPNGVAELRQLFREFLETSQKALELHETYAQENPVYRLLQESLVDGLNRLTSAVQPYLK